MILQFHGKILGLTIAFVSLSVLLFAGSLSAHDGRNANEGQSFSVKDIKGNYAFSFDGQIIGVGPVAATGAFYANGKGHVTEAVRTISIAGYYVGTETFSCTLEVNANGTGKAVCPLDNPAPNAPPTETFNFVLEDNGNSFRMVGTTPGIVVLGSGQKQ